MQCPAASIQGANAFRPAPAERRQSRGGFTLIELLVVVGIIAVLIGVLVPSLGVARDRAKAAVCLANLKGIGNGLMVYATENADMVVPSYNMNSAIGGAADPLDGWAPILDRDGVVRGTREAGRNVYYCPGTVDVEGMAGGQTGADADKPRGWMDWPSIRVSNAVNAPTTIPALGFDRIIRVSYWVNAENPIGAEPAGPLTDRFYTLSVGYGRSDRTGPLMRNKKYTAFARPQSLVAMADGVYAGRQTDGRLNGTGGVINSRVGYRHGGGTYANAAFADGHAESSYYSQFPRAAGKTGAGVTLTAADVAAENAGGRTIYADPSGP